VRLIAGFVVLGRLSSLDRCREGAYGRCGGFDDMKGWENGNMSPNGAAWSRLVPTQHCRR